MASSEVLAIERLALDDVAGGLALSDAAGWNQSAADWSFFIDAGAAFAVRDEGGTPIATAAALPYDSATGWVSMVLVDAGHRHRGIASQLVDACVSSLRESGRTPVLDATPAGAAVYAKTGFVEGFAFERWQGEGAVPEGRVTDGDVTDGGRAAAVPAAPERADILVDLDRHACGVDRARLLRAFLARENTSAWFTARADGFALRRAGRRATQIGPIVAAHDDDALDLLAAALHGVAGLVFIDVPVHCTALVAELTRRGFTRQRSFVRMALGATRAAAARPGVFALAGPEFG